MPPDEHGDVAGPVVVQRHPSGYDYRARFQELLKVFVGEGSVAYIGRSSEGYAVITDESTLADLLGEELDAITVRLFVTRESRDAYAARLQNR